MIVKCKKNGMIPHTAEKKKVENEMNEKIEPSPVVMSRIQSKIIGQCKNFLMHRLV